MATAFETLKELHQCRSELAEATEVLKRGPQQLAARQNLHAKKTQAVQDEREMCTRLRVQADEKELSLKSTEQRARDLKIKLNQSNSNKEYHALREEIAHIEERNDKLEEETLELITQHDEKMAAVAQTERELKQAEGELEEFKKELEYKLQKMAARSQALERKIQELEGQLDPKTLSDYRRLIAIRGENALAACENGTCTACYTGQTPQTCSELSIGRVVYCDSCGAMLYSA